MDRNVDYIDPSVTCGSITRRAGAPIVGGVTRPDRAT
jgi:hypothetical protein